MISITTILYDLIGYVTINQVTDSGRLVYQRRTSKAATLDGLSSISDFGYTASDNTLTFKLSEYNQPIVDRLIYLVKNYPILRLATEDGIFIGVLNDIRFNSRPIEFIFDIKERIV